MTNNIFKVLISNICIATIGIISSFVFPRIMSIDAYSEYQSFNLYLSYIGICQVGLATGMVINYAGKKFRNISKKYFVSEIRLLLIILLSFAVLFEMVYLYTGINNWLYISIVVVPYCFVEAYKSFYQAWSEFTKYSIYNTIIPVFRVIIVLSFFFVKKYITGESVIYITIGCYFFVFLLFIIEYLITNHCNEYEKIFSRRNAMTLWLGIRILMGNYLDTLFKTCDKFFVNVLFDSYNFAMYSFAMTMHNIMNIFVTSIAQPMFPYMASHELKENDLKYYKEILLMFGAFASSAYYACAFVVKWFLPKYMESIIVMLAYFAAFPVLAVINCIFINLYKIRRETKSYIISLIGLLMISILLNGMSIVIINSIVGIAIATTIVYYCWFVYECRRFRELHVTLNDLVFLIMYNIFFIIFSKLNSNIIGFCCFILMVLGLSSVCYKKSFVILCQFAKYRIVKGKFK